MICTEGAQAVARDTLAVGIPDEMEAARAEHHGTEEWLDAWATVDRHEELLAQLDAMAPPR